MYHKDSILKVGLELRLFSKDLSHHKEKNTELEGGVIHFLIHS